MLGRDDLIAAARKLWGEPTEKHEHEWRFGGHKGKSIDFNKLTWYDFTANEGGGVVELCRRAGINGNFGADEWGATNETAYQYRDENSKLLFEVVRTRGHEFRQRHYDEHGNKVWNMKGVRRVLYRLPQLIDAGPQVTAFVVEGEKDADNLAKLGFTATTNPGGAGKWRPDYSASLKDFDVVILPDNDEPGISHALKVKIMLAGVAHSCRILKLPGLKDKGDVSDWIAAGGTAEQLRELVLLLPEDEPEQLNTWIGLCSVDKAGAPIANFENSLIGVRNDLKLKDIYAFDEMQCHPMTIQSKPRKVSDYDISIAHNHLQSAGLKRVSRDNVRHAIFTHAEERRYHPLRDALNALEWDQQKRNHEWLSVYLGAEPTPYNNGIGALFLRSMMARIFQPGCKVDYMLILEGPQGALKSMACRVLASDEYFSDNMPDVGSGKDVYLHLRGIWIQEISEMHAFSKVEANQLKAFLTQQHHQYRPPYAAMEVDEPRQCVFIGTSNKEAYLRDETGGRRFWPVKCGKIDIQALREDRDQLLAEAVAEYKEEMPWWPETDFEQLHIVPEQQKRYEIDPWYDSIAEWLESTTGDRVTVRQIAGAVNLPIERLGQRELTRIGACVRAAGWTSKHQKNDRWWERPKGNGAML